MLNHAAVVHSSRPRRFQAAGLFTNVVFWCLGLVFATSAAALDSIDLSVEPPPLAEGECPRLIQIKYPFLRCADGEIGLSEGNDTWQNARQIPRGGEFIEGNGYWGDELNPDRADR